MEKNQSSNPSWIKQNFKVLLLTVFLSAMVASGIAWAAAKIAPPIPTNPDQVMRTALAAIGRSASWSVTVTNAAAVDAWASANLPAELAVLATRQAVINILVEHCDETDNDKLACTRLGPDTNVPALDCTAGATMNGKPLPFIGTFMQYQVRQIFDQTTAANSSVPLWVRGRTATAVDLCFTATF